MELRITICWLCLLALAAPAISSARSGSTPALRKLRAKNKLANTYLVLRHGQSLANVRQLIVSTPKNGVPGYGLTTRGKGQVRRSIRQQPRLNRDTLFYSSDFLRARQTAGIARGLLGVPRVRLAPELRERDFGALEGDHASKYRRVHNLDKRSGRHRTFGVESVDHVADRVASLVLRLEKRHQGKTIVLTAHGDTLQILLTTLSGRPASQHRSIPHLYNAEVRPVRFAGRPPGPVAIDPR